MLIAQLGLIKKLAKAAQNPIASMISIPSQWNATPSPVGTEFG